MEKLESFADNYLNLEGQIINLLSAGPMKAGDIYRGVSFSQPAVSSKLARLQDRRVIFCYRDDQDNRVIWYKLADEFMRNLLLARDKQVLRRGIFF